MVQRTNSIDKHTAPHTFFPEFAVVVERGSRSGNEFGKFRGTRERSFQLVQETGAPIGVGFLSIESGLNNLVFIDAVHVHRLTIAGRRVFVRIIGDRVFPRTIVHGEFRQERDYPVNNSPYGSLKLHVGKTTGVRANGDDGITNHIPQGIVYLVHSQIENGSGGGHKPGQVKRRGDRKPGHLLIQGSENA